MKSKKTLHAEKKMKKNNLTTFKDLQHASSSNIPEYSSDESLYSVIVKKNLSKKPKMQMSFWETYKKDKNEVTS